MSHGLKNESKIKVLPAAIVFFTKRRTLHCHSSQPKCPKYGGESIENTEIWHNGRGSGVATSFPAIWFDAVIVLPGFQHFTYRLFSESD